MNLTNSSKLMKNLTKTSFNEKPTQNSLDSKELTKKSLGSFVKSTLIDRNHSDGKCKLNLSLTSNDEQKSLHNQERSRDKILIGNKNPDNSNIYASIKKKSMESGSSSHFKTFDYMNSASTDKLGHSRTITSGLASQTSISNKFPFKKQLLIKPNPTIPLNPAFIHTTHENSLSQYSDETYLDKPDQTNLFVKTTFNKKDVTTQEIKNNSKQNVNITINQYFHGQSSPNNSPKENLN